MRWPITCAAASPCSSAERSSSRAASCAAASSPRTTWTHELPVQGREELRDVAQLAAQLARPRVGAARLRRREALRGDQRLAQRELQLELAPLTLGLRRAGPPAAPAPRSAARPPRPSPSARAPAARPAASSRPPRSASPASAQWWASSSGSASAVSGKRSSSTSAMRACSSLPPALEQALVGRVPHQRVLEGVARLRRRRRARKTSPARDELVERRRQLGLAAAPPPRPAARGRTRGRSRRRPAPPPWPRASRSSRAISESCSVAGIASGAGGRPRVAVASSAQAGLEHRLGQLLDEQRHPVGPRRRSRSSTSAGSALPPVTRSTIASACRRGRGG